MSEGDRVAQAAPLPRDIDLLVPMLTEPQAYALAELCKRIGWQDVRGLAAGDGEARNMIAAIERVRGALELVGVRVR